MKKETQVKAWGNGHGILLTKDIMQSAGITTGSRVEISTEKRHGTMVMVLKPVKKPSLAEKYANYHGTPESYENPEDLRGWQDTKPVGKELL